MYHSLQRNTRHHHHALCGRRLQRVVECDLQVPEILRWALYHRSQVLDHGPSVLDHGPSVLDHDPQVLDQDPRVLDHDPQTDPDCFRGTRQPLAAAQSETATRKRQLPQHKTETQRM